MENFAFSSIRLEERTERLSPTKLALLWLLCFKIMGKMHTRSFSVCLTF